MKRISIQLVFICSCLFTFSCIDINKSTQTSNTKSKVEHLSSSSFQSILDAANVQGSLLIFNPKENIYYSNDFDWANKGQLPASTFKIPHSIIALELGIIESDTTTLTWDGEERGMDIWEQDLTFGQALQYSCVPCYQDIARKIGLDNMRSNIGKLNYGSIDVDSSTLDNFWLRGTSRITPLQQIDFLFRLYNNELSITPRTESIIKSMLIINKNERYMLSGKTGWSNQDSIDNGWFVGRLKAKNESWFFATNVEPQEGFDMNSFAAIRKEVTLMALNVLAAY